jgi:asparagine synthetase B (glutamine-hydrolysing)
MSGAATENDDVVARACRAKLLDAVAAVGAATDASTRCIILSGGVDTAALMAASAELKLTYAAAITVLCGPDAPDRAFAASVASKYDLQHHVIEVTPADLIREYLPSCVRQGLTLTNPFISF